MQTLRRVPLGPGRHNTVLVVAAGSILDYTGDAFVNAANEGCTGGFGVDEQVNKSGGFKLKEARKALGGCPTGEAKVTESYEHTKVRHIIHAVGPVYRLKFGMDKAADHTAYLKEKDPQLVAAYRAAMQRARELHCQTLGLCPLSAGVFRGEIGLDSVVNNCYEGLREVTIVAWTKEEQDMLVAICDKVFPAK